MTTTYLNILQNIQIKPENKIILDQTNEEQEYDEEEEYYTKLKFIKKSDNYKQFELKLNKFFQIGEENNIMCRKEWFCCSNCGTSIENNFIFYRVSGS